MTHTESNLHIEMPQCGGHVGFIQKGDLYYNEVRALEFLDKVKNS